LGVVVHYKTNNRVGSDVIFCLGGAALSRLATVGAGYPLAIFRLLLFIFGVASEGLVAGYMGDLLYPRVPKPFTGLDIHLFFLSRQGWFSFLTS
jgi:hypothetical protein